MMPDGNTRVFAAIAVSALLAATSAAGEALWWNKDYGARRQMTVHVPDMKLPGDDAAVVDFRTAGMTNSDGSDIRVVARGRELPHVLYGIGPGDTATIAFKADRDTREHYIYFGNAAALAPQYDWQPQRGLVLQTRGYKGGDPGNIARMWEIWRQAGPFYGAGGVDKVWHGQNMFGPSQRFVSLYTGWLACYNQGQYAFATTSDDASFLLVDGQLVVAWPGWHGPVADARHNAAVNLKPGLHRFEYLHVDGGGTTCAVAAWRPPGAEKFEVIPAAAFAPLSRAVVGDLELAGQRIAPDFTTEITGEALMTQTEELYAVRVAFVNQTAGSPSNVVYWDFGDGQKGKGPSADHIYLASGVYPVTMRLGTSANSPGVTQRIHVHQHWGWQTKKEIDDIGTYFSVISRYDIERLDAASLVNLMKLADEQGSVDFARRVALAAISKADCPADDVRFVTRKLRDIVHAERLAADEKVLAAYRDVAAKARGERKAAVSMALCDVLLERGQAADAAEAIKSALGEEIDDATKRRLFIACADASLYGGDVETAVNALRAAASMPLDRSAVQEAALAGAVAFKAEDYLAKEEYAAAEEALDAWGWEKPLEKLEGYSSFLRARLYSGQGRYSRALAELKAILTACPDSAYAPKALLAAAKIEQRRGNLDAAKEALAKIMEVYPASPEAAQAKQLRLGLGGL